MRANADKRPRRKGLSTAVASYLCAAHRDNPRDGCPFASLGAELARADAKTRAAATEGFLKYVDVLARHCGTLRSDQARKRAMVAAATMIGALTMARVVNDPELSDSILKNSADSILLQSEMLFRCD